MRPRSVHLLAIPLLLAGWLAATIPLAAQITDQEYAERRGALAAVTGEGVVLAMGSAAPPQDYIPFHQNSPFRYLTGFTEPDAALLMEVREGEVAWEALFVNPRDPATETWEGYRVGPEGARDATGVQGRNVEELQQVLDSLVAAAGVGELQVVGAYDPDAAIRNDVTQRVEHLVEGRDDLQVSTASGGHLTTLRGVKSEAELELLRKTTAITVEAHREVMRAVQPGMNEFEIQALVEYTFRRYGSERPAFASIVGSGPNSTILHYNQNDRFMEAGDVLLVDIGSGYGGYAADITRTMPVSGTFSEPQREIYQLVRDAQAAAEELAEPGVHFGQMAQAAAEVLARGLTELGLIEAPDEGLERISPVPREVDEIEALMAEPWDGPGERNQEWVEWYRLMK